MSGSSADRIEIIEEGRQAVQVAAYISEPIKEYREKVVKDLVNRYRSEDTGHDRLVGGIAEISALDSLMSNLENKARLGNVAAEKEYKNG